MPTGKCSLPCSSRKFLFATENITKKKTHNQSKCKVVEPSSNRYTYKILLNVRLWEYSERGGIKIVKSQVVGNCYETVATSNAEATPIMSHQYNCLNKNWTNTKPVDIQRKQKKAHNASTLHKEIQTTKEC